MNLPALVLLAASGVTVFHNVTVIDGTGSPPRRNVDVVIRGERIATIDGHRSHPDDAVVIDGTGKFLLPGLVDMHAHVLLHPWNEKGEIESRWHRPSTLQMLRTFLDFGVTTIRDPGAPTGDATMLRTLLRRGDIDGPELFTAGRILTRSNFNPEPFVTVTTPDEVRDEIQWQAHAGVDVIKVYGSMPPELLRVAVEEAHRLGLPVIGHLQRTTWTEGARLGVDGVEHAAPWSADYVLATRREEYLNMSTLFARVFWLEHLDTNAIDQMVRALSEEDVVVDPTLIAMHSKFWGDDPRYTKSGDLEFAPDRFVKGWPAGSFTAKWTPEEYAASKKSWPALLDITRRLARGGVRLVIGTDTPTPWIVPGASVHDEMKLFEDAGIDRLQILRAATVNAAMALRRDDEFGSVEPGKRADLILLGRDPLQSIVNTRTIELVMQRGRVVSKGD